MKELEHYTFSVVRKIPAKVLKKYFFMHQRAGRMLSHERSFGDTLLHKSSASRRCLELRQLVADRIEEAYRPLREEVATLKLLLAGVDGPLQLTEACASDGVGLALHRLHFRLTPLSRS